MELVGGPENGNWSDYSEVWMKRDNLYRNYYQVSAMKIREEWKTAHAAALALHAFVMNPSIVNAAYVPTNNAMIFPAGILVPPFFDFEFPMAVNLGRIGMVMGHELLHGFDNNGRQFDKDGNKRQWWDDGGHQGVHGEDAVLDRPVLEHHCAGLQDPRQPERWARTSRTTAASTWRSWPS